MLWHGSGVYTPTPSASDWESHMHHIKRISYLIPNSTLSRYIFLYFLWRHKTRVISVSILYLARDISGMTWVHTVSNRKCWQNDHLKPVEYNKGIGTQFYSNTLLHYEINDQVAYLLNTRSCSADDGEAMMEESLLSFSESEQKNNIKYTFMEWQKTPL